MISTRLASYAATTPTPRLSHRTLSRLPRLSALNSEIRRRASPVLSSRSRGLQTSRAPKRPGAQADLAASSHDADQPPIAFGVTFAQATSQPILSDPNAAALRAHFDLPYSISGPSVYADPGPRRGLFLHEPLMSPCSLKRLTNRTLVHATAIVDRIVSAPFDSTGKELRLVIKNLDRLSDLICGVIDMCELVRNAHPDQSWKRESDQAYTVLCGFMNELNAKRELWESLVKATTHPHPEPLSSLELKVAHTFLADFERSGIHLPPVARANFVKHSDNLISLGRSFLSSAHSGPSPMPAIEIPRPESLLGGNLDAEFVHQLPRNGRQGPALVVPGSWEASMISHHARDGEARRLVYMGSMREDKDRVRVLEEMLTERAKLADVLGKESWAHIVLADKMAKTPHNVMGFLESLLKHNHLAAQTDVARLQGLKWTALTGNPSESSTRARHLAPLYAWDKEYYSRKYTSSLSPSGELPSIAPYFSVGTVMAGLSNIFSKLHGISFRPSSIAQGEVWHSSVRRLDVLDEKEGVIGYIYCDFFSRPSKPIGAAHYTVRCSRRVDDDDVDGDRMSPGWDKSYGGGLETRGEVLQGKEGRFQLPIVVLTTNFGSVAEGSPALLDWNELETLFHEMGHAIHSMIGRTEYHNVSGTRCPTDFVELPSILMEHFVSSPEVLSTFGRHYITGEALPIDLIESHLRLNQSLSALEVHGQISMALLDQKYHSLHHGKDSFDSTAIWNQLQTDVGVIDPVPGTAWQTQFGHLYGYGAMYYSYLFDRAIAGKVWSTLFTGPSPRGIFGDADAGGILNRDGGDVLKDRVLKWGGGKDPWEMVGDVIGGHEGEVVSRGDKRALELVGSWMLK
ncbi:hypothetical protein B9479_002060 [Cryptococcus floricola]|uniref:Mitochondrial intermediate peptidase 1 n=1 Tax=Cryptococcus floricola TaxID=2591691 RepID=A0A5D3B4F6_9TREE|nr:hypothetical protein B9479_002060 [Cryptococcus floricola]